LVTPGTYEPPLLAAQYLLKVGVFQCDGWDIISNVSAETLLVGHWEAVDGMKDNFGIVDTDLFVKQVQGPRGFDPSSPQTLQGSGQFLHASAKHLANTPVFQKVWDKVFELGRWQDYEWTIKLDVDAVPLPVRLHNYLKKRPQRTLAWDPKIPGEELPYKAEYLFNARHDMYGNFLHGPAEAVSRGAMQMFRRGRGRCKKAIPPMEFGEDFYLNKCLELLGIPSVKAAEVPLLYDTYEWGEVAQTGCSAQKVNGKLQNFGVYHAHKNITDWLDCYAHAKSGPNISDEMWRLAIQEVKRSPAPRPTTVTTTTATQTTFTLTTFDDTGVMMMAGVQSKPKEDKHALLFRVALPPWLPVWPLLSLFAAGLVVAPVYFIIKRRQMERQDSEDIQRRQMERQDTEEVYGLTGEEGSRNRCQLPQIRHARLDLKGRALCPLASACAPVTSFV
jgi:hypothetical protein